MVKNTGLKLEELDEKAVVYQSAFSHLSRLSFKLIIMSTVRSVLVWSNGEKTEIAVKLSIAGQLSLIYPLFSFRITLSPI